MKILAAAVLWVATLAACEGEEPVREPIIRPVRTHQVFSTGGTRVRTFSGTAQAGLESRLSFRVSGKVQLLSVNVEDNVKAGDLIAELDSMDYRGQFAKDVCSDLAIITGYNFWAQYDELSEPNVIQLFFDSPDSTAFASLCKISNVLADSAASNVFAPSMDTVHRRDPSRIAAGVYLPYDGGSLYHYSYPTAYSYGFRDQVAPTAS